MSKKWFQVCYFKKILLPCALFIPLTLTSCTPDVKRGREYFDTHADVYLWKCNELEKFFFHSKAFGIQNPGYTHTYNYPHNYLSPLSIAPLNSPSSWEYFDGFLSENLITDAKMNTGLSQYWKKMWESFYDRSVVFWKHTDYYDVYFCYRFINVIESTDDKIRSLANPREFTTNWTLETELKEEDIHFFPIDTEVENFPDDVLLRYNGIKSFFLSNNKLTFNSLRYTDEYESIYPFGALIQQLKWVNHFDKRRNITIHKLTLNN
ncbi:MAG: hypothetical protein LBV22_03950 [Mycoplasmataceae bacterium]|jgi:hypothetical protein|nr:hypothetical protein [Mycoplasmataceae bacterium]